MEQKKRKSHYINNKDFYEWMKKYKFELDRYEKDGGVRPQIPNYIGECFLMICNRLSTKPNFINYTYRDDMVADGIENCIASMHNFDPEKSNNPFAYFTQIAWNAFIRRIAKEKKQTYIKHKNYENNFMMEELSDYTGSVSKHVMNDISADIIKSFEEKNNLTKLEKQSKVGVEKFVEVKNEKSTLSTS